MEKALSTDVESDSSKPGEPQKWLHLFMLVATSVLYLYFAEELAGLKAQVDSMKGNPSVLVFAYGVGGFVARTACLLAIPVAAMLASRSTILAVIPCLCLGAGLVRLGLYWHAGAAFVLALLCAVVHWSSAANSSD